MKNKINWGNLLFLTLSPIAAAVLTPIQIKTYGLSSGMIVLFIFYCLATSMSITGGYHRLFSHQSYRAESWVKFLYLIFGAAAFQGSAAKWSTDHRIHHRKVDTDQDPYSIKRGFWYAHMGWIFFADPNQYERQFPADLKNDRMVMWQHRNYWLIGILVGFLIPGAIGYAMGAGPGGLVLPGLLRLVFTHHCTFLINSGAHYWGSQPYNTKNSARDNAILAFLTYGEGYHNFHHHFETDYRNGIKWYQWDPTKWLILFLSWIGAARHLKKVNEFLILRAQIRAAESQPINEEWKARLAHMRTKLEQSQQRFHELKAEYISHKNQMRAKMISSSQAKIAELKADLKAAEIEWKLVKQQCKVYMRFSSQLAR